MVSLVFVGSSRVVIIVLARAWASPGGTSQPVFSGRIVSWQPPWLVPITSLLIAWASTAVRPKDSGCVEQISTISARA